MYFPQLKDSILQPNDKNTWEKKTRRHITSDLPDILFIFQLLDISNILFWGLSAKALISSSPVLLTPA